MERLLLLDQIKSIARSILNKAGEVSPPVEIENVVRAAGVELFYEDLPEHIDAFMVPDPTPFIIARYPRESFSGWARLRFSIMHELGHYVLGHFRRKISAAARDREADAFAAEVLMPTPWVRKAVLEYNIRDLWYLQNYFLVSKSALVIKLRDTFGLRYYGLFEDSMKDHAS